MCESELASEAVGVALDTVLAALTPPRDLDGADVPSDAEVLAVLRGLLESRERLHGVIAVALRVARERGLDDARPRALLAELSPVTLTGATVFRDTRRSHALTALPRTAARLLAGTVSAGVIDAAARGLAGLPPEVTGEVAAVLDGLLAAHGPRLGADDVDRLLAQAAQLADPDGTSARATQATDTLRVTPTGSAPDDPLHLRGRLHGPTAELVNNVLERLARPATGDDARPHGQRLAAALVQACRIAAGHPDGTAPHGADAHVVILATAGALTATPVAPAAVTADGRTLTLEQLQHAWCAGTHTLLGVTSPLPGAITPGMVDQDWQHLTGMLAGILPAPLGATIEPLYVGRAARTVTRAQWYALIARDRTCRHPQCSRPPSWCQAHHRAEWDADHGPTDITNLVLLCWEHHALVHARHQHLIPDPRTPGTYHLIDQETWDRRRRQPPPLRT